jgi:hypothetical protein
MPEKKKKKKSDEFTTVVDSVHEFAELNGDLRLGEFKFKNDGKTSRAPIAQNLIDAWECVTPQIGEMASGIDQLGCWRRLVLAMDQIWKILRT